MAITVEAVHRKVQYTSTGSLGPYAFAFKVLAATDIKVSVDNTLKTVTTHYITAYNSDGTGSVTFTSGNAPAADALVTIESNQAIARTTDYSTGGDFTASSINDALDRLTINDQQIETELTRGIQLSNSTKRTTSGTGTSGPLIFPYDATVSNNASKLIAFDSNGTALETTTGRVNSVTVSGLSAGASPTATFTSSTGALALGIPAGATGSTGSTGSTGASGSDGSDGVGGLLYTFSTTTSDADPGAGKIRLNHATIGSATAAFIDDSTAASGNPDVSAFILTWDDSTQTSDRGQVTITKKAAQQNFATFKISGASTDASGYVKLALTHVVSNGSFSNDDAVLVSFVRTGNAGNLADPMTTRGDIIVRDSSNATARLAVGSANTVLQSDGTDASYGTIATAMIANNAIDETKLKDALIGDFTEVTATASDTILLGDSSDAGNTKRDTIQGILDLAGGGGAWELLVRGSMTSAASELDVMDTGNVWTNYDVIRINLLYVNAAGSTGSNMCDYRMRLSLDGSSVYTSALWGWNTVGDELGLNSNAQDHISMTVNSGTAVGWAAFGYVDIVTLPAGSGNPSFQGNFNYWDGAAWEAVHFGGYLGQSTGNAQCRGARFYHPSRNTTVEYYSVLGLKES